jgi:hypothetical protein
VELSDGRNIMVSCDTLFYMREFPLEGRRHAKKVDRYPNPMALGIRLMFKKREIASPCREQVVLGSESSRSMFGVLLTKSACRDMA